MEELFIAVFAWFAEFGWGFAMLILSGVLVAAILEIMVKKSFAWLQEKWIGHDRLIAFLNGVKILVMQLATGLLSIWFARLVVRSVDLPGDESLFPIWVCAVYLLQYVFSMIGWKGLVAIYKDENGNLVAKNRRPNLTKTNYSKIYKDENGNLVDKNGRPVNFG